MKHRVKPLLILNKIFCRSLTEIKSVRLVISEAGNAVRAVVLSSSAEIFTDLMSFIFSWLHLRLWLKSVVVLVFRLFFYCKVQVQKGKVLLSILFESPGFDN